MACFYIFFDFVWVAKLYTIYANKSIRMFKRFSQWVALKAKLHNMSHKPPLVSERDLWWIIWGENIGSEMNGKSSLFSRPGLVLKKLSRGFYLVAPTTTQIKMGSWYVTIQHEERVVQVCLNQIRTIDYRRLSSRLGRIDSNDFISVKNAFWYLYK